MIEKIELWKTKDGRTFPSKELAEMYEEIKEYLKYLQSTYDWCKDCKLQECKVDFCNPDHFYLSNFSDYSAYTDYSIRNYRDNKEYFANMFGVDCKKEKFLKAFRETDTK